MSDSDQKTTLAKKSFLGVCLTAVGIVFGDIGTSPLYTFKTILSLAKPENGQSSIDVLGLLSLVIWTLFLITTIKYVYIAMRFDNEGEGGIIALMTVVLRERANVVIASAAIFGATLVYADGMITPAISVLSALEGMQQLNPSFEQFVLPSAIGILLLLFIAQPAGTEKIGRAFGPFMLVWFISLGLLGIGGIMRHPGVLVAANPLYAFHYLTNGGGAAFTVMGGIFLCATGAEALYADMGQFGAKPIRWAWNALVFPALALNYAGQAALVLSGQSINGNIFYNLCPPFLLTPMIILATIATIIASQAIITGAFSMTRQAIQLDWMPRLKIVQTSETDFGQIYIGFVNWTMMVATILLVVWFKKSDNLASAYGVAVSMTMLLTTLLLYMAIRKIWKWSIFTTGALILMFLTIDGTFLTANLAKIKDGGYIPLTAAGIFFLLMWIWHRGSQVLSEQMRQDAVGMGDFLQSLEIAHVARVPGTGVFMTSLREGLTSVIAWHVRQNRSLNNYVIIVTLLPSYQPRIKGERITLTKEAENFWRVEASYGYLERIHLPWLMRECSRRGCQMTPEDIIYYFGRETVMRAGKNKKNKLPGWVTAIYSFIRLNVDRPSSYWGTDSDHIVEIGREISL